MGSPLWAMRPSHMKPDLPMLHTVVSTLTTKDYPIFHTSHWFIGCTLFVCYGLLISLCSLPLYTYSQQHLTSFGWYCKEHQWKRHSVELHFHNFQKGNLQCTHMYLNNKNQPSINKWRHVVSSIIIFINFCVDSAQLENVWNQGSWAPDWQGCCSSRAIIATPVCIQNFL